MIQLVREKVGDVVKEMVWVVVIRLDKFSIIIINYTCVHKGHTRELFLSGLSG